MKARRQAMIREIVESQSIQTQEELAEALRTHGMVVTQATVSRDIKEMHLLKVLADNGNYRYATMEKGDSGTIVCGFCSGSRLRCCGLMRVRRWICGRRGGCTGCGCRRRSG